MLPATAARGDRTAAAAADSAHEFSFVDAMSSSSTSCASEGAERAEGRTRPALGGPRLLLLCFQSGGGGGEESSA